MQLYEIDPLGDSRWADLVERNSASSVFHTPQWLAALRRTYAYQPVAFTDASAGEPLSNGLLFCRVRSWMTGRRLVSLPFSDHCEPLVESPAALESLADLLKARVRDEGRYIELRPLDAELPVEGFTRTAGYCHHAIDLRPDATEIFARFHKNHVQRTIRKAQRSGLTLESGRSATHLTDFYALHALTRRRHKLPVQPLSWFQNLVECLGDDVRIFLARRQGAAVAAMLTTTHKKTLVYKYGCSDDSQHRYGGPSLLFWTAIQHAKRRGLIHFDLGRSDWDDPGLIAFKDHLGAQRKTLSYYRCSRDSSSSGRARWWPSLGWAYSLAPRPLRETLGSGLYRHFG
jgi:CelD/BcsL family acetyltransferase involved in cellulose biosynthesis